jgi:DNA invertase Pin-like site-specific DNA recombinase
MGKRAGIYRRISDDREGMELGVERQGEDTEALCDRAGDTIVDSYTDNDIGASTRSQKRRPEYERLLADARSGRINKIVAYTSSRLTRRPREHEDQIELAEQFGVEFAYVASPSFDLNTAAGRRIARILAANDAGEAEDTSERVKRQRQQAAAAGKFLGTKRPFGYEADGVTVRGSEAEVLLEMTERVLAGESVRSVAADLNQRGMQTSTGRPWTLAGVRSVLRRPRNAGLSTYNGEVIAAAVWPAIVEEPTWRAIAALLADPSRRTSPGNSLRHLGAGLYLCGRCEALTTMRTASARRGGQHGPVAMKRVYRCSEHAHLVRVADPLDAMVGELVIERLSRKDAVDLLDDGREDLAPLHLRLTTVRTKMDELVTLHRQDLIDGRQLALGTKELRDEKQELEERIAAAGANSVLSGIVGAANVRAAWLSLPISRRQAVVADLMTVVVLPSARGRRPKDQDLDPDSVHIERKR